MRLKSELIELRSLETKKFERLKSEIAGCTREEWLVNTSRQDFWEAHRKTESIVLKIGKSYALSQFTGCWQRKWKRLIKETLIDQLEEIYGAGEITRLIISKLLPNSEVGEHSDTETLLKYSHRVHLPITTNEQVVFKINGQGHNLKEGVLYEISNLDPHSVINPSAQDRIHIIVDYADREGVQALSSQ